MSDVNYITIYGKRVLKEDAEAIVRHLQELCDEHQGKDFAPEDISLYCLFEAGFRHLRFRREEGGDPHYINSLLGQTRIVVSSAIFRRDTNGHVIVVLPELNGERRSGVRAMTFGDLVQRLDLC